ncbi:MAG: pyrroline-5-carboxylate reductase [Halieaceae bacterium]|nr:pyrroline-5-carboxylate reductase [Halieaceae bacterium]RZO80558.1 MAG: pyrroline-5-carboxylate reductase [Halieaceae bacterium]
MAPHIAFLGAGNMASAMISGLIAEGFSPNQLRASDPSEAALARLQEYGLTRLGTTPDEIFEGADLTVAAVKPQIIPSALASIKGQLGPDSALLSIAAGIPIASLQSHVGPDVSVIRCMPNTPAMIGLGASALFAADTVSASQRSLAEQVTNAAGTTVWVASEALLDAVTAVSGSGPAYFFALIEAIARAGTELGLDEDISMALTIQTALGAAALAQQSGEGVATLRENVTSPGGTTEQALQSLQTSQFDAVVAEAVRQCAARARTLGEEFG